MPPQQKVPYKKRQTPMSVSNLRLQSPIGQESLYGRLFGFGTNVAETLSGSDPSSIWENYMAQASTAADTLRSHPGPSAGALLLYEAARRTGIGVDAGKVSFPTKYGKFKIGTGDVGGAKGFKLQFDLDKSILGKLEKRLMQ